MKKNRAFFILIFSLLASSWALAISDEMKAVVYLETQANAVATRSNKMIPLQHYEIPLSLLESDVAKRIPDSYLNSLVFTKADGQKYVRWIINPEDTKWHLEVAEFLKQKGLSTEKKTFFEGYKTASRSYIVVNPESGAEFSIKVSTNNTGGHWVDKKQTWSDAKQIRMATDFVMDQVRQQPALEHVILLDEPLAFGIKALDQGLILRSYEGLSGSGKIYVPGFSVMHELAGANIAIQNGSKKPGVYWNDNYNRPLARALAEFMMISGMTYDSPHSQNFMVELDKDGKPTGKIVLRDFGDTYLVKPFFQGLGRQDLLDAWESKNVKESSLKVSSGILHGNVPPTWMNMKSSELDAAKRSNYFHWAADFQKEFSREIYRQTGLKLLMDEMRVNKMYISRMAHFIDANGKLFLQRAAQQKLRDYQGTCQKVFAN